LGNIYDLRNGLRSSGFNKKKAPVRLPMDVGLDMPGHLSNLVEEIKLILKEPKVGIHITNLRYLHI
jgi:hypothetical protein